MSFRISVPLNYSNISNISRSLIYSYKPEPPIKTLLILQKIPRTSKINQSLLSEFFPEINVRLFDIPTSMTKKEVESIIDNYVKETRNNEIVLNLDSQQMTDYGLSIVSERPSLIFINMISTVPSIRGLYSNLYFGVESDDIFISVLLPRVMGNKLSSRYLIIQSQKNVFVDNIALSFIEDNKIRDNNIKVIKEDDIDNYKSDLENATSIFICSLTNESQLKITSSIPKTFKGSIVFIDAGPLNSEILINIIEAKLVFTHTQASSLAYLPSDHIWNLKLKSDLSNTCTPAILGLYTVILNSNNWKKNLIESKLIYNTSFGVNSIINQINTLPS